MMWERRKRRSKSEIGGWGDFYLKTALMMFFGSFFLIFGVITLCGCKLIK